MKICLLNLPWDVNGRKGVRAGSRWPFTSGVDKDGNLQYLPFPFFLAYAASLLKKNSIETYLIDAIAENISNQDLFSKVKSYNPSLVVVETSTPSFKNDIKIIRAIRNGLYDCQIALCGPHASIFSESILREYDFIDYILIGEYEYVLLDLVKCLEKKISLRSVGKLSYREGNKVQINSLGPAIDNLDCLPWPERNSLPMYKYNDGFAGMPVPNVQMMTSRGCSFRCTFCLWPQAVYGNHNYRFRNADDVVNEMEYLTKRYNFRAVYFDDDTFNMSKSHVMNICRKIIERKINIPWAAMARADLMDEELIENIAKAEIYAIKFGIESANQQVLNLCNKDMDIQKARRMIKLTQEFGIKVHLTFCLGLPGETMNSIRETIEFIDEINPHSFQFSFAVPFPGTEYFSSLRERGQLLSYDWDNYDGNLKCIVRTDELHSYMLERIRDMLFAARK